MINSATKVREYLIKKGLIKMPGNFSPEQIDELRKKGRKACSRVEAILARRSSFKIGDLK